MRQCLNCGQLIVESPTPKECPACQFTTIGESFGYLPYRVLSGSFGEGELEVVLRDRKILLASDNIKMIVLGIVEEPLLAVPPTAYLQMKESVSKLFNSESRTKSEEVRKNEKVYLEMFVLDQDQPFRFESSSLDYRGFFPEVDYISENNLKKFLTKLTEKLPKCKFDNSLWAYLANQKAQVNRYPSIYEFQRECLEKWEKEKGATS